MIHHVWSVLCERCIVDAQSNNMSLIQVTEQLNVSGDRVRGGEQAVVPVSLELVGMWERGDYREPETGRAQLRLLDPSGTQLVGPVGISLDLTEHVRCRSRVGMSGIPITGEGRYWFVVEQQRDPSDEWAEITRVPLQVDYA
jgi:hypothetical protein